MERRTETEGARRARPAAAAKAGVEQAHGEGGALLLCARCRHRITTRGEEIEIDGLREHSQVNPHGFVWTFHCFARAPGCMPVGAPSSEFTWFPGHTWQVVHCRGCAWLLGWRFACPERRFYGLIAGRLVEAAADGDAVS